jgi:hypothetical protein
MSKYSAEFDRLRIHLLILSPDLFQESESSGSHSLIPISQFLLNQNVEKIPKGKNVFVIFLCFRILECFVSFPKQKHITEYLYTLCVIDLSTTRLV